MTELQKCVLNTGAVLNDKWIILGLIGKGAMGEVYRAHQLTLQRDVAIKIISKEWLQTAEDDGPETETIIQRFHREFQAMAQVRHPNVIQIYDYGTCSGQKDEKETDIEYIAMEYIPGATLRFTMSDEGFEPDEKLIKDWIKEYFIPLLDGVQALHTLGIIHRDLKPENILLDGNIPKITDFGLARSSRLKPLSQTADAQGTLSYMSPEQFIDFKWVDQRGDIFSLGRILFEAVAGKISKATVPFKQVKLSDPGTPFLQSIDRIIQEATAEDREQRMSSAEKMRSSLLEAIKSSEEDLKGGQPRPYPSSKWTRPKWIWGGLVVTFSAVLLMGLWHFLGEPGKSRIFWKASERAVQRSTSPGMTNPSKFSSDSLTTLPPSIMGEDGSTMLLIRGGELQVNPADRIDRSKKVLIKPFYMDENKVSNENFVEFLNEVKQSLVVENGVVKSSGQIWFLMGEGTEPYEHIIYKHGRFHLKNLQDAAQPVVRVTRYGAMAYAHHYHKQLPTEDQWIFAAFHGRVSEEGTVVLKKNGPAQGSTKPSSDFSDHMSHMDYSLKRPSPEPFSEKAQTSQTPSQKNRNFPKNMGGAIKEWAVRSNAEEGSPRNSDRTSRPISYDSVILGSPAFLEKSKLRSQLISNRYPWEGFPNVGFRCIIKVGGK